MNEKNTEYLASLKSIETENIIDRIFYRPIGFRIAKALRRTGITPNMVTIASIFVGMGGGLCFVHPYNIWWAIGGITCLVMANIMDCIDGQLARLTGIKSEVGRILDGMAGDIWFATIYICFIIRLSAEYPFIWGGWSWVLFLLVGIASGLSHLTQAAVTDYYKTVHLFFISPEKGREFETSEEIKARLGQTKPGINRFITRLYILYTRAQEHVTPYLQQYLLLIKRRYGSTPTIPEEDRQAFRSGSRKVMHYIDWLSFNGRTLPLFVIVLSGEVWLYFVFEIVILNTILFWGLRRHEEICRNLICETRIK